MIALLPIVAVLVAFVLYFYLTRWRDQWLRNKPFPAPWLEILVVGLPIYGALSEE